jgi:hypothetical protein
MTIGERRTVHTPASTSDLFDLYESKGHEPYGESITQIEHALQCAALARDEHASDAMTVAALFPTFAEGVITPIEALASGATMREANGFSGSLTPCSLKMGRIP